MTPVFADSSYYIGLLVKSDQYHADIVESTAHLNAPIVTTAWVLTEVANALSAPQYRTAFLSLWEDLKVREAVTIVEPTEKLFCEGIELYRSRSDKTWSLTDCISFVVMDRHGMSDALTTDHHFEQAGFRALLK